MMVIILDGEEGKLRAEYVRLAGELKLANERLNEVKQQRLFIAGRMDDIVQKLRPMIEHQIFDGGDPESHWT